jgi:tRNA (cmo5U34)-methyltransferase
MTKENVGEGLSAENANWNFSGALVDTFDEHIQKSVPLYRKGHDLVEKLSDFFITDNSISYELGSATGKLTYQLASRCKKQNTRFIGIDTEKDMVAKAQSTYQLDNLEYINGDVNELEFEKSDLIVAYYTIQFISPSQRQQLIDKIFESLNWGGAFIYFEKVRAPDARFQDIMTSLYTDYKLDNGYSPDEIVAKSRSLKGVLEPFSTRGNLDLLSRAGFVDVMSIMKYVSFEGFLAIK